LRGLSLFQKKLGPTCAMRKRRILDKKEVKFFERGGGSGDRKFLTSRRFEKKVKDQENSDARVKQRGEET